MELLAEKNDRHFLPLFDGTNYTAWKYRISVLLEEHELLECVYTNADELVELMDKEGDSEAVKKEKKQNREARTKKDRRCKSILVSRIHDSQLEYVQDQRTPKDVWDALKRVFERHSIASRMHLKRQLIFLRFEGGTLQEHFLKFDRLVRDYRATGATLEELDVICYLLITVGSSYSTVVTTIESLPAEILNLEFVKCRLLDEETKRKCLDISVPKNEAAFSSTKQSTKPKSKVRCFGCKMVGHKLSECPNKKNSATNTSKAHMGKANAVSFVGVRTEKLNKMEWFIDSGCSEHLVNDKSFFTELTRLKQPIDIAIAKDDATIRAEFSGTVHVVSNVYGKRIDCIVNNVLFVPNLRCNLFSVMRVDAAGMTVVYKNGTVQIRRGAEIVACGTRVGKLYQLDFCIQPCHGNSMLTTGSVSKCMELWHRRLGHLNARGVEQLIRNGTITGLQVNTVKDSIVCESCLAGKQTRNPFPSRSERRSSRVLELIHSDVCGPVSPVGVDGERYFVTFMDDWSHFCMVFLIHSKEEVYSCFRDYEAAVTAKFGKQISRLRCDNGGEYRSKQFELFLKQKGIMVEWTVPHTPQQNGVSERLNRTLNDKARTMLQDSGIEKHFWGKAVQTAAYLLNRSPTNAIDSSETPYERWEGKKPNLAKLRVFGCNVYVHIPKEQRAKMDAKAWKGVFVGYGVNGYLVWNPKRSKIVHVRDVVFLEDSQASSTAVKDMSADDFFSTKVVDDGSTQGSAEDELLVEMGDTGNESGGEYDTAPSSSSDAEEEAVSEASRSLKRQRTVPVWHKDYEMEYAAYALSATIYVENLPNSLAEARKREDWPKWKNAVNEEMQSLKRNKTWELVKLPEGRKPITCKWVFAVKRDIDGKSCRYKARLVARGFTQKYGFDYNETYSPVARLDTLRIVLAYANERKMVIHQMDVRTAFLNGTISEEIFMMQPEGFLNGEDLVCRLRKSLYGLKQASKAWNDRFDTFIQERLGFRRSLNDQCLYTRTTKNGVVIIVLYVDDLVIAGSTLAAVEDVKTCLSNEFEMKDIGDIKCFLGMNIRYNREEGVMQIQQQHYLQDVLRRFKMETCKPCSTPMENRLKLPKGKEEDRTAQPYRELIGCLMYAAQTTRPDLAAAVNFYSQFQSCPTDAHWTHLKRVLRYVQGSLDVGLVYRRGEGNTLEVYADADWANDPNDRRSVSGSVFKMFGSTVAWITRKQQTVALSSTEAELTALCVAVRHGLWMTRLLRDLDCKVDFPVTYFEDNQSTMSVVEDSKGFGRLKHIDVKLFFLKDLVKEKQIVLEYVPTANQQADMMTKGLPVAAFRRNCQSIGLASCSG